MTEGIDTEALDTEALDLELSDEEIERRYQEEMVKRLTRGERHYRSLRDLNIDFDADPYAEPLVRDPIVEQVDVVVVGTGWAGMSTAAYLTKQGITSYRIIDKAGDFGGTWYWNRYPGCMCDVESYTYLPLLEEVGYMPTKKYAHAAGDLRVRADARPPLRHVSARALPDRGEGHVWNEDDASAGGSRPAAATSSRPGSS